MDSGQSTHYLTVIRCGARGRCQWLARPLPDPSSTFRATGRTSVPVHRVYIDDHTQPLEALAEAITRIEADGESVVHIEATGAGYAVVTSAKKSRQTRVTAPKETR